MLKFLLFWSFSAVCSAADWSSLYSGDKLKSEQARLETATRFAMNSEIEPFISPQQAMIFALQEIDFPVEGFRSDPLDFYGESGHIVLPIRTLLFLEDLSRCYAWLWTGRYSTRTADEYLSMLRYRSAADFKDGQYPAPLSALHVPENALSDPKVVQTAVRLRRTAYAFILLHEFAHLQLHHEPSKNRAFSEAQEEEADRYALNIMKGNSATPTGVYLVMDLSLLLETGNVAGLHPVSAHRLEAMAHFLDGSVTEFVRGRRDQVTAMDGIHSIAMLLREGSEWLSSPTLRAETELRALRTDPSTLEPRPLPKTTR